MNVGLNRRMRTTLIENPIIKESPAIETIAQALAERLSRYTNDPDGLVLTLPNSRAGLPTVVSDLLGLQRENFIVRALCAPCECACIIGALTETGVVYLDPHVIFRQSVLQRELRAHIEREIQAQRIGIARQLAVLRPGLGLPDFAGRHVLFVDEGRTPSAVLLAIIEALRRLQAKRVIVATSGEAKAFIAEIRQRADEFFALS